MATDSRVDTWPQPNQVTGAELIPAQNAAGNEIALTPAVLASSAIYHGLGYNRSPLPAQVVPADGARELAFDVLSRDNLPGAWNGSDTFTAPSTGVWHCYASLGLENMDIAGNPEFTLSLQLLKNAGPILLHAIRMQENDYTEVPFIDLQFSPIIEAEVGDEFTISIASDANAPLNFDILAGSLRWVYLGS